MQSNVKTADERVGLDRVENAAERVVLSFRAPESDPDGDDGWWVADSPWLVEQMNAPGYLQYLRRAHVGPIEAGEEFEEFVNCGCASPEDVVLRVERVEGGDAVGRDTEIEVVPRKTLVEEEEEA